jgi:hypothetical protein
MGLLEQLPPTEAKLVHAVVDTARTQGKPTPKSHLDKIIADESGPLLNQLQRRGLIREEQGRYFPTLRAILDDPNAQEIEGVLDAAIDLGKRMFDRDVVGVDVDEFVSGIVLGGYQGLGSWPAHFLSRTPARFLLDCAFAGLHPYIDVQQVTAERAPKVLGFGPKIQRVGKLADVIAEQRRDEYEAEETRTLASLYNLYLQEGNRRRAIVRCANDDYLRRQFLLHLVESGKLEQYDGGFILSDAGLDEARSRFGGGEERTPEPQTSPAKNRDQRIGAILSELEQVATFDERLREVLRRDVEVVEVCRNAKGAEKAVLVFCGSILEGVLIAVLSKRVDLAEAAFQKLRGKQKRSFPDDASLQDLLDIALDPRLKLGAGPLLREANEIIGELVTRHRNLVHPHAEARGEQLRVTANSAEAVYSNLCVLLDEMLSEIKAGWLARYVA